MDHAYIPEVLISLMSEKGFRQSSTLKPDTIAPNFTLHSTPDQSVTLSQFLGNPIILAFYPADFSPVCGDQMTLYNQSYRK
jgi:peroxiredoxin